MRITFLFLFATVFFYKFEASELKIVPWPKSVLEKNGQFRQFISLKFSCPESFRGVAELLSHDLKLLFGCQLQKTDSEKAHLILVKDGEMSLKEGYEISIDRDKIILKAGTRRGAIWGDQL